MTPERSGREGMALLVVLLLVAVLSVVAVAVLDDVRFSIRRATNAQTGAQAQWFAIGAENLAVRQVRRLHEAGPLKTPMQPDWNGRRFLFPIEEGTIEAVVRDGQACFNLNSLVEGAPGAWAARPRGVLQFIDLMRALDVPEARARMVADAAVDWIDSDDAPRSAGAEDGAYATLPRAYRTAGGLMIEPSELRAVQGVDAATYRRLRPYLCALPEPMLSPLNVNTLTPDQAPLIQMLGEGRISLAAARSVIAARPNGGWLNADAFWNQPALRAATPAPDVREQVGVRTRYFRFDIRANYAGATAVRTGLIEISRDNRIHTVVARWIAEE